MGARSRLWLSAIVVAVVCAAFLAPDCASACSCAAPAGASPQETARRGLSSSDAVFAGEVVDIHRPWPITSSVDPMTVTFRVSESWKGAGQKTLEVKTAVSDTSCGYPFDEGERYLVFASKGETYDVGDLEVALCGSTKPLMEAGEELAALGSGSSTPTGPPPAGGLLPDTSGPRPVLRDAAWTLLFVSGAAALTLAVTSARLAGREQTRR